MKIKIGYPQISIIVLLSVVAIISVSLNIYFAIRIYRENIVVEVIDGDTFQLASGKRVRLMGVDAPEYDLCGGPEATNRLSQLIGRKRVNLKEEITESYGRSLALVYVGQSLINKIIMREGWGRPDYRKNSQRDILTVSYHQAQKEEKGIFGLCRQDSNDTDCKIKANIDKATSAKFYHLPGCLHYEEVVIEKDRGEKYYCTEIDAQKAGFRKASACP